ncbi:hypothetical protein AAMO2058_000286300 [Amorphochlora amoebiformis]
MECGDRRERLRQDIKDKEKKKILSEIISGAVVQGKRAREILKIAAEDDLAICTSLLLKNNPSLNLNTLIIRTTLSKTKRPHPVTTTGIGLFCLKKAEKTIRRLVQANQISADDILWSQRTQHGTLHPHLSPSTLCYLAENVKLFPSSQCTPPPRVPPLTMARARNCQERDMIARVCLHVAMGHKGWLLWYINMDKEALEVMRMFGTYGGWFLSAIYEGSESEEKKFFIEFVEGVLRKRVDPRYILAAAILCDSTSLVSTLLDQTYISSMLQTYGWKTWIRHAYKARSYKVLSLFLFTKTKASPPKPLGYMRKLSFYTNFITCGLSPWLTEISRWCLGGRKEWDVFITNLTQTTPPATRKSTQYPSSPLLIETGNMTQNISERKHSLHSESDRGVMSTERLEFKGKSEEKMRVHRVSERRWRPASPSAIQRSGNIKRPACIGVNNRGLQIAR